MCSMRGSIGSLRAVHSSLFSACLSCIAGRQSEGQGRAETARTLSVTHSRHSGHLV